MINRILRGIAPRPGANPFAALCLAAATALVAMSPLAAAEESGAAYSAISPGTYEIQVDVENARTRCRINLDGSRVSGGEIRARQARPAGNGGEAPVWYSASFAAADGNERACEGLGFIEMRAWTISADGRQVWLLPGTAPSGEWRIIFVLELEPEENGDRLYRAYGGYAGGGREPLDFVLRRVVSEEQDEDGNGE